jgi:hypothetical protein
MATVHALLGARTLTSRVSIWVPVVVVQVPPAASKRAPRQALVHIPRPEGAHGVAWVRVDELVNPDTYSPCDAEALAAAAAELGS